jgi:hypothetical protein
MRLELFGCERQSNPLSSGALRSPASNRIEIMGGRKTRAVRPESRNRLLKVFANFYMFMGFFSPQIPILLTPAFLNPLRIALVLPL